MEPSFRQRYEQRGRVREVLGQKVEQMSREDLYAVIGYLTELAEREGAVTDTEPPLGSEHHEDHGLNPRKNDGLYEG